MDEPQDFATLVRRHQGAVCAVAYAVLRDRGRSEEVAQEAFLVAWQKLPSLEVPPTMPAWICGIARNLAANAARRRKETAMIENDGRDLRPADPHTPLDSLLDRERQQLAERALGELPAREREVVTLYYRNEQSLAEVASALGISAPAARQGLHRGRERLKSALAAVETTLRATRPSPAFTAACVAALAGGLTTHASAATAKSAGTKVGMWLAAVALAAGVIIAFAVAGPTASAHSIASPNANATPGAAAVPSVTTATSAALRLDPVQRSIAIATIHDALAAQAAAAAETEAAVPMIDEPERAPHHLTYDFSGMTIDGSAESPTTPPPRAPVESKARFRAAFKTVAPLIYECVTRGHPERRGSLRFSMHFVGDPQAGTVADAVELGSAPGDAPVTLVDLDAAASECVHETLMSIELPGPKEPTDFDVSFSYTII